MKQSNQTYLLSEGVQIGGKATQLIYLAENNFNIPSFKVIPAEFFRNLIPADIVESGILTKKLEADCIHAINQLIAQSTLEGEYFSVRSSATSEDGVKNSFAGQFDTFLFVPRNEMAEKVLDVWKSAHSTRVKEYSKLNHIQESLEMAVIIQKMIHSDISGVMFGINPVTLNPDEMLISAVYGLGEGIVSGELDADNYYIKNGLLDYQEIAEKTEFITHNKDASGTLLKKVDPEKVLAPALNSEQLSELISTLQRLNNIYKFPQDVEWAFAQNQLHIFQSRPITNLKNQTGTKIVWDNSNIIESYPGVTTPLTFSFIREMYRVVYTQFSELLGVSQQKIKDHEHTFANMLGLIRGRVYYNLRSWYEALALVPGYSLNARFMEGMMGVKERFDLENHEMSSKFSARIRTIYSVFKIIISLIRLPKSRRRFLKFVDATIAEYKQVDFHNEPPEKLMNHYKKFEKILTEQWNPPLVNDFFAMIYFGVFQKLVGKWIDPDNPHLHNDLLSHNNDIISVQPMIKSLEIAKKITQNPEATKLFQLPPKTTWKNLQNNHFPEIKSDIDAFLYKFGERCLGELKLETISYTQAPEKFIKILQAYVNNPDSLLSLDKNNGKSIRQASQQQVTSSLKNKFFKKLIFNYFLRKTRNLVSNRENLRFERTRGFGIVRAIFSAMGYQFQQMKLIQHERDIFYLTKEEIFDYINGTSYTENLMDLIASRKSEFASFEKDAHVPERITTFGTVYNQLDFDIPEESILDGDIKGTACCPGIVQAEVCIIHSPDEISDLQGKIMVTSSTDPGWVSLFPSASGILVERGSLLSHSAIVARELGIPCIVGIKDLLKQLKSGDRVEMDGSTGFVKIIKS